MDGMDGMEIPVLMTGSEPSGEMTNMETKFLSKDYFSLQYI